MLVKFYASTSNFVRNIYRSSFSRLTLDDRELKEVLGYKNISESFTYYDFNGKEMPIKATLVKVETDGSDTSETLIFTIKVNRYVPIQYAPTPSDILRGKNLLFPIGVQPV